MPGFRFINSQGELQVFGRQEGGSGLSDTSPLVALETRGNLHDDHAHEGGAPH